MTETQLSVCKTCLNRKKGVFDAHDICNIRGHRLQPEVECPYYDKDTNVFTVTEDKQLHLKPNDDRAKNAIIAILVVMSLDIISGLSSVLQFVLLDDVSNGVAVSDDAIAANDLRELTIGYFYFIAFVISAVFFIRWFRRAYYNLQVRTGNCKHSDGWAAGSWFVPFISLYRPYQIMKELAESTSSLLTIASGKEVKSDTDTIGIWWALWIISNYIGNYLFKNIFKGETLESLTNSTILEIVNAVIAIPLALFTVSMIKKYAAKETALTQEEKSSEFLL